MPEAAEIWKQALPKLRESTTGVGIWAALNAVRPIVVEDGVLYVGLRPEDSELGGHLKLPNIKRLIETIAGEVGGQKLSARVIDGTELEDVERTKRRDAERRRLQERELEKMRLELQARTTWESVYEQLSRRFAAMTNKSLPQNRARFLYEAVELLAEARKSQAEFDDLAERNFARCLERVAQYTELPSVIVASRVLERAGEL
jgi:hypothetical protein